MFRKILWMLPGLTALWGVGCVAPTPRAEPTTARVAITDYEAFVDHALTTLRSRDMQLDPAATDRKRGRIVAGPVTGAQFFEFWRSDSQGAYQLLESSLHTIGRWVYIHIDPLTDAEQVATAEPPADGTLGAPGGYRLSVRVEKKRYTAPERQVTTASTALAIYSERLPTEEGVRRAYPADAHWVALGRDGLLEDYLLARLLEGAGAQPLAAAPAGSESAAGIEDPVEGGSPD